MPGRSADIHFDSGAGRYDRFAVVVPEAEGAHLRLWATLRLGPLRPYLAPLGLDRMRFLLPIVLLCAASAGCGTTKWTDTRRTAMEQLLITDAMDRAVSRMDFKAVAGKEVYLDTAPLELVTDSPYLASLLRQHMLSSGCIVRESRSEADYVVEVRAGAVGTDRREVVFGVPATRIPAMLPVPGIPSNVPELPLATRTEQRAVAKIAAFAYNRKSGRPVWQSGVVPVESTAKHVWFLGAGPFERGTIHDGTRFVGDKIKIPLITPNDGSANRRSVVSVADEAFFSEPEEQLAAEEPKPATDATAAKPPPAATRRPSKKSGSVVPASHTSPSTSRKPVAKPPQKPAAQSSKEPAKLPAEARAQPLPPPPSRPTSPVVDRRRAPGRDGSPLARTGPAEPNDS